jgi:uncharacterized protein YndB with AHSA1/START domain
MSERSVVHDTFVIERHYPVPPSKTFAAFADPAKKRRWFAEGEGFQLDSFEMDFRVGGMERARFRFVGAKPLAEGTPGANDTYYTDIVPDQRIVIAYTMTVGGKRISSSQATMEFLAAGTGTKLIFTEQAAFFEGADGVKMREAGTRQLLDALEEELAR